MSAVKSYSSRNLLDIYVLSALMSVLVTRLFLVVTGYPQLGGDGLHIAHVLWGGLLMMLSTLLLLLSNDRHKLIAAIIGGVGFGLFVDEIGKFITSNVNYFYQPAAVIIYLIIVAIWLVARFILTRSAKLPFLPPVSWPKGKWQRRFVITMLVLIGLGALLDVFVLIMGLIMPGIFIAVTDSKIFGFIIYVLLLLYVFATVYSLWQIAKGDRTKGLTLMRGLIILTIVISVPFSVYTEQFIAYISLLIYLLFLVSVTKKEEW